MSFEKGEYIKKTYTLKPPGLIKGFEINHKHQPKKFTAVDLSSLQLLQRTDSKAANERDSHYMASLQSFLSAYSSPSQRAKKSVCFSHSLIDEQMQAVKKPFDIDKFMSKAEPRSFASNNNAYERVYENTSAISPSVSKSVNKPANHSQKANRDLPENRRYMLRVTSDHPNFSDKFANYESQKRKITGARIDLSKVSKLAVNTRMRKAFSPQPARLTIYRPQRKKVLFVCEDNFKVTLQQVEHQNSLWSKTSSNENKSIRWFSPKSSSPQLGQTLNDFTSYCLSEQVCQTPVLKGIRGVAQSKAFSRHDQRSSRAKATNEHSEASEPISVWSPQRFQQLLPESDSASPFAANENRKFSRVRRLQRICRDKE